MTKALRLLAERFESPDNDGPVAYPNFLTIPDDEEAAARLRNQAVAVARQYLSARGFKT